MSREMSRVKVALIDSGVNQNHPHVGRIAGGLSLRAVGDRIIREEDFTDHLGHGTAIAGIVRAKAPTAAIYALRVFERTLTTYPSLVAAAIYEALALGCQVINMSFTVPTGEHLQVLAEACRDAHAQGCLLVAAAGNGQEAAWPADWPKVIAVYGDENLAWEQLEVHQQAKMRLGAHPYPRPLPGRPQQHNLKGNSFACAHATAFLANLLAKTRGTF